MVLARLLVAGQADHRHGVPPVDEILRRPAEILQGPGPDREDAPAGVEQHEFFPRHRGEISEEPLLHRLLLPFLQAQPRGRLGDVRKGSKLIFRHGRRLDGVHEGQELVADVAVGVVQDGPVDKIAPVEPFHRVPVEPDPQGRPAEKGEDAAHAGEELAVDDDVEAQFPHFPDCGKAVADEPPE